MKLILLFNTLLIFYSSTVFSMLIPQPKNESSCFSNLPKPVKMKECTSTISTSCTQCSKSCYKGCIDILPQTKKQCLAYAGLCGALCCVSYTFNSWFIAGDVCCLKATVKYLAIKLGVK